MVAETNFLIDIALKQDLNVLHLYDLAKIEQLEGKILFLHFERTPRKKGKNFL
ncbi:MAG: hypothetical protein ACE5KT_09725 [Methanosarcinales archaeon]